MKVRMVPHPDELGRGESGIHTVIRKYFQHLPALGVDLVPPGADDFDILHVHAGMTGRYDTVSAPVVSSLHGLYWTADHAYARWMYEANRKVVDTIRNATEVTVPSAWVNETLARDMHFKAHVVPHGIDIDEWDHDHADEGYVVAYAKNRAGIDVSSPASATELARRFPDERFVATFAEGDPPPNLHVTGLVAHDVMRGIVQKASVYVSPVKETFGLGALEAMAAGVPVLTIDVGQVPELVGHGIGGYCYRQDDIDDMIEGLAYCLRYRNELGANARQRAEAYTWEGAAEKIYGVYESAARPKRGTVDVVIPVYNKEINDVRRAIGSCLAQSREPDGIIVVDDGSDNGSDVREVVEEHAARGAPVRYIRQHNRGVAHARNRGISASDADYVVCLDADDKIEPEFISKTRDALQSDPSLWVAYTKLRWIKPDGSTGVSQWPGEWDYDKFLKRQNQVPTCCMFRRELWRRLGGYRQRYAPTGAGAEDAEFFARAGAYGYRAELVSGDPLFVYSWQSGHTSQEGYKEVDWMAWHIPWQQGKHPFASYATPANALSHPVRQYDEPSVSVVIPVGPGHEEEVVNALDSLEAQTYMRWEAVVVWDAEGPIPQKLLDAYPFVRWFEFNTVERMGAGAARNFGAEMARAGMLLFLDADDWLYPQFLGKTIARWNNTGHGTYTDYVGKALVDDVSKLAPNLQNNVLDYDGEEAVIGYQAANYDCEKAQRQPEMPQPYIWCNITTLIPKAWHEEIGGFDETLDSWEDVDYWWRMARAGKCFSRIEEPLMVYRFYSGSRRDQGLRSHRELASYLSDKYSKEETEMCGCRSSRTPTAVRQATRSSAPSKFTIGGKEVEDSDVVMVEYNHPNVGQHPVIGPATRRKYGYRAGGERFLVHKDDVQHSPTLFKPVGAEQREAVVQRPQRKAPPPPEPVMKEEEPEPVDLEEDPARSHTPLDLSGLELSKRVIQNLARNGFVTEERVLDAGEEGLVEVKWIGEQTAQDILEYIRSKRNG